MAFRAACARFKCRPSIVNERRNALLDHLYGQVVSFFIVNIIYYYYEGLQVKIWLNVLNREKPGIWCPWH